MGPLKPFFYKEFVYEMRLLEKKLAAQKARQEALENERKNFEEER